MTGIGNYRPASHPSLTTPPQPTTEMRRLKGFLLSMLVLTALAAAWVFGPFKWRVEMEFGISLPDKVNVDRFIAGPSRTFALLNLGDPYEMGSVCELSADPASIEPLIRSLMEDCNFPYRPDKPPMEHIRNKDEYTFHLLPKNDGLGDYRRITVTKRPQGYDVRLSTMWD